MDETEERLPAWMRETVRVRASDFAKFTGHNTFVTPDEAAMLFWQRNSKLAAARGICVEPETSEVERDIRQSSSAVQTAVKQSLKLSQDATASTVARAVEERYIKPMANAETAAHMSGRLDAMPKELKAVQTSIEREAQKMRGTRRETTSINRLEAETGRAVVRRNSQCFQKSLPIRRDDVNVVVVGMLDGRFADDDGIVEVKERRSRLFGRVVSYELVQLHCYMFLTGAEMATLVERFDDQHARHAVAFDSEFWAACLCKFSGFLDDRIPVPRAVATVVANSDRRKSGRVRTWPARGVTLRSDGLRKKRVGSH
tara:strand:- start:307 stop:1248 length:942 start_codon:yes stop_codon:yes gene_type:complete